MTGPVTTEALVEKLARHYREDHAYLRSTAEEMAQALVAGPLAPLLAALQQVTAERDEARAKLLEFGEMYDREDKRVAAEIATATSELARLRAEGEAKDRRIAALEAALEPFAWFGEVATPDTTRTWSGVRHTERISTRFRHEHFRAARTALARAATAREGA